MTIFNSYVAGIPCQIEVNEYTVIPSWKGNIESCPSADDWYGGIECDFTVLDRRGYAAEWLERKMSEEDKDRIESEIAAYFKYEPEE